MVYRYSPYMAIASYVGKTGHQGLHSKSGRALKVRALDVWVTVQTLSVKVIAKSLHPNCAGNLA